MEKLEPLKLASCQQFEEFERIIKQKLLAMHKLGIAHKDIKPNNIMVALSGEQYYFIDFGIS